MSNIDINLSVTPAGAELIVRALRTIAPLPDSNIDAFVAELWAQYQTQMQAAQNAPADPVPATNEKEVQA